MKTIRIDLEISREGDARLRSAAAQLRDIEEKTRQEAAADTALLPPLPGGGRHVWIAPEVRAYLRAHRGRPRG